LTKVNLCNVYDWLIVDSWTMTNSTITDVLLLAYKSQLAIHQTTGWSKKVGHQFYIILVSNTVRLSEFPHQVT